MDTWFSSGLWPFATLGWPENKDYVEAINLVMDTAKRLGKSGGIHVIEPELAELKDRIN